MSDYAPYALSAPLRLTAIALANAGMVAIVASPLESWPATAGVVALHIAVCLAMVGPRLREVASAVLPDLLTLYLVFQAVASSITLLNLVVRAGGMETGTIAVGFGQLDEATNPYRFRAECVFLATTLLFVLGWLLVERQRAMAVWRVPPPRTLWTIYAFSSLLFLGILGVGGGRFPSYLGNLGTVFQYVAIGSIAALLGGGSHYALGRKRSWIAVLALTPFWALALQTGMKGAVVLSALPIVLPLILRPTRATVPVLVTLFLVLLTFVFPFSHQWREMNWVGGRNATAFEVANEVVDEWDRRGMMDSTLVGAKVLLSRGTSSDIGGLVMRLAEVRGHLGGSRLEGLIYIFIPRFLWKDKPLYKPGAWFTWYLGQARSVSSATSSTAIMLGTELYWMYGVAGVLFGATFLGLLYAACWRALLSLGPTNALVPVGAFVLSIHAISLQEKSTIFAFSQYPTQFVYILFLCWVLGRFAPGILRRRRLQPRESVVHGAETRTIVRARAIGSRRV